MGDGLWAGKSATKVNSAFHTSKVGKSSTGLYVVKAGPVHLCQMAGNAMAGNTVWFHTAGGRHSVDSSEMDFLWRAIYTL